MALFVQRFNIYRKGEKGLLDLLWIIETNIFLFLIIEYISIERGRRVYQIELDSILFDLGFLLLHLILVIFVEKGKRVYQIELDSQLFDLGFFVFGSILVKDWIFIEKGRRVYCRLKWNPSGFVGL